MLRPVQPADADAICGIYNHYVLRTIVTFEETAVSEQEMRGRIAAVSAEYPWFVYEIEGKVSGYAYASRWKSRCSYRYAVESTVYLDTACVGKGLGTQLYTALIAAVRERGMHAIIGGVALPNPASAALHEKCGFQKVAHFKEVGWKLNQWIDVGYWELIL